MTTSQNHFEMRFGVAFARFENNFMNTIAHSQREVEVTHTLLAEATDLFDESHALSYALVMALAHTPRKEFSQQEIDGLCQLAYELLNKLTKVNDIFRQARRQLADSKLSAE